MPENLTSKLIRSHLVDGEVQPGSDMTLHVDQVLTQDATGTMVYLQFQATGVDCVLAKLAVSYVDHNMLQVGFENADDHRYLQSVARRYGIYFSRPGNGICHQVHLERFSAPGELLLGSDSHTPTAGALGMLAIGAGGLDVAVALATARYHLAMPRVFGIELRGQLSPWVSSKDVIFEVLRRLTVKGWAGWALEYFGDGVPNLDVYDRATISNMGAEIGVTTSIFPSDERTRQFLVDQGRGSLYVSLSADPGASYDSSTIVDLATLQPMVAQPYSPDNVVDIGQLVGLPVQQVAIGSCTNSSLADMLIVAEILKGHRIHPEVSLVVSPGSRQVLAMMIATGALSRIVDAGGRILECACGPCNGIGQAPASGSVSVRTMNRNYKGRSGTADDRVYLASPEVAAASALAGCIVDPRELGPYPTVILPSTQRILDSMVIPPQPKSNVEIITGPNIRPIPNIPPIPDVVQGRVELKLGDSITTDDIIPGGAVMLSLRSNVPAMARYVFGRMVPGLGDRLDAADHSTLWFIVAGENYGQGSSREHAVLAPAYLGLRAVVAKSFARIYRQNLINYGLLPLEFASNDDYDRISGGDVIRLSDVRSALSKREDVLVLENLTTIDRIQVRCGLTSRESEILLAGGLLKHATRLEGSRPPDPL